MNTHTTDRMYNEGFGLIVLILSYIDFTFLVDSVEHVLRIVVLLLTIFGLYKKFFTTKPNNKEIQD